MRKSCSSLSAIPVGRLTWLGHARGSLSKQQLSTGQRCLFGQSRFLASTGGTPPYFQLPSRHFSSTRPSPQQQQRNTQASSDENDNSKHISRVVAFSKRIGENFSDSSLLLEALTPSSSTLSYNARLQFLGDNVLRLALAKWLLQQFPNAPATALSQATRYFGSSEHLARVGAELGIKDVLPTREEAADQASEATPEVLSPVTGAVQALLGAIYQDRGATAATNFVHKRILPNQEFDLIPFLRQHNPKGTLRTLLVKAGHEKPYYRVLQESAKLTHRSMFKVGVFSDGKQIGEGTARSRYLAEQAAAQEALNKRWGDRAHLQLSDEDPL
ncbi:54S ribosomal protein L3 mitochondrial [Balamuthia mandrillaris]